MVKKKVNSVKRERIEGQYKSVIRDEEGDVLYYSRWGGEFTNERNLKDYEEGNYVKLYQVVIKFFMAVEVTDTDTPLICVEIEGMIISTHSSKYWNNKRDELRECLIKELGYTSDFGEKSLDFGVQSVEEIAEDLEANLPRKEYMFGNASEFSLSKWQNLKDKKTVRKASRLGVPSSFELDLSDINEDKSEDEE